MPVVRIPLASVERVSRITFGIRFSMPADAALAGTRFKRWYGQAQKLEAFIQFLSTRGITVDTLPRSERVKGFVRDVAVAQRPGWNWRDRGWLGFLESAVSLAIALAIVYLVGSFPGLPTLFLAWLAFVLGVTVWGWVAGDRRRKRLSR